MLTTSDSTFEKLWRPDLYFPGTRNAALHNVTQFNAAFYAQRTSDTVSYTTR